MAETANPCDVLCSLTDPKELNRLCECTLVDVMDVRESLGVGGKGATRLDPTLHANLFSPYALFVDRQEDLLELLRTMLEAAPAGSLFAVESDERFDFGLLPDAEAWDLRRYLPALVGIYEKPEAAQ